MRATPTLSLTRNSTIYNPSVNTGAGQSGLDAAAIPLTLELVL